MLAWIPVRASAPVSYVLRMQWTSGTWLQLKVVTTVSGFATPPPFATEGKVVMTGVYKASVTALGDEGATIETKSGPFLLPNGETILPLSESTQHVNRLGVATEAGEYMGVQFPKESVKVGATWPGADPLSRVKDSGVASVAKYHLLSVRTVARRRVADISFSVPPANGKREAHGKLSVDVASGRIINGVATYEMADPQAGVGQNLILNVTVTRL